MTARDTQQAELPASRTTADHALSSLRLLTRMSPQPSTDGATSHLPSCDVPARPRASCRKTQLPETGSGKRPAGVAVSRFLLPVVSRKIPDQLEVKLDADEISLKGSIGGAGARPGDLRRPAAI